MFEQQRHLRDTTAEREADPPRQRVMERLEGEVQPESDRFFNVGLAIVSVAASAVIAIPAFDSLAVQAALGVLVLCLIGSAIICFFAGREINRARRLTRSIVLENVREI
jgi:hypothetical protein